MSQILTYDKTVEETLSRLSDLIHGNYGVSKRTISLLLLQGDAEVSRLAREREGSRYTAIAETVNTAQQAYSQPLAYIIARDRQKAARHLASNTISVVSDNRSGFSETLRAFSELTRPARCQVMSFSAILALIARGR